MYKTFLILIPNLLILFSVGYTLWNIVKNPKTVLIYVDEIITTVFLILLSSVGHLLWVFIDYPYWSYILDPLAFAITSSIAYKVHKDQK